MYVHLLKYYNNDKCKKLNISCDEHINDCQVGFVHEGYVCLKVPFSLTDYLSLSPKRKSHYFLELISNVVCCLGKQWDWDLPYFDAIKSEIIKCDYKNQWKYGKTVNSPARDKSAYIWVEQTIEITQIYLMIKCRDIILNKILIIKTEPTFWSYVDYLGRIVWAGSNHLNIINKKENAIFTYAH